VLSSNTCGYATSVACIGRLISNDNRIIPCTTNSTQYITIMNKAHQQPHSTYYRLHKGMLAFIALLILSINGYAQGGLLAQYYDGSDFDKFVSQEYVDEINESWYGEAPAAGIDPHDCSIRWSGQLRAGKTATYLFAAAVDDGIRVWVDGELIINQWHLNDMGRFSGEATLTAGTLYDLKVEYFNALHEGEVQLQWAIDPPKEKQSWYERVFGVEHNFKKITAEHYVRKETPKPNIPKSTNQPKLDKTEAVQEIAISSKVTETKSKENSPTWQPTTELEGAGDKADIPNITTVAKATKYVPKHVAFVRTKAEILPESYAELNTFASFMVANPHVTVTVEGHTDVVGVPSQNQFLSERRANTVARYLVTKGVLGRRIQTVGYGGSKPLKLPAHGEYHPPNRRVVFVLTGLD